MTQRIRLDCLRPVSERSRTTPEIFPPSRQSIVFEHDSVARIRKRATGARQICEIKSCGSLLSLCAAFPERLKASAELAATQGDDGVGTPDAPAHARALKSGADHKFAAGLHDSRGRTETLLVKLGIAHAASVLPDVVDTFPG